MTGFLRLSGVRAARVLTATAVVVASATGAWAQTCNQNDARLNEPGMNAGVTAHLPFTGNDNVQPPQLQFTIKAENFKPLPPGNCPPGSGWRRSDAEMTTSEGHKSLRLSLVGGERILGLTGTLDAKIVVVVRDETTERVELTTKPPTSRVKPRLGRYSLSTAIYRVEGNIAFDTRMQFVPSKNVVVFVLCPDNCSIGEVEQGRRFIEQETGGAPPPSATIASNPSPSPTANIPPPAPVPAQKGAQPASAAAAGATQPKNKGPAPPNNPTQPSPRASLQKAQQGLALQVIDPARGTAKPFTGFAKALLGNCARRDEARPESFRGNTKIPLYLTAAQGSPICVVFQPDDRTSRGETCVMLPGEATESKVMLAEGMATEAACGDTPAWQVRFTDSRYNRPIARGIVDEMILHVAEADKLRIAGVPVDRMTDGTYQAKLRLEDFGKLDKDAVTQVTGSELGIAMRLGTVRADHTSIPPTIHITADSMVVALDNKVFELKDTTGQSTLRCELSLDLDPGQNPKWGHAWDKLGDRDLILRLNPAEGRYALAIANRPAVAKGAAPLQPLSLDQLFVKSPKANTDESIKLKHLPGPSESACFLAEPSLNGPELEAGYIKRTVGKTTAAFARFILPDLTYTQARLPVDDYIRAVEKIAEFTAEIGEWRGVDTAQQPFVFHATVVATSASQKPEVIGTIDQLRPSSSTSDTARSKVKTAINDKVPAATLSSLRGHIRELFTSRGASGGDRLPISIVAIGRVITDRGDNELCNASAASRFENMRQEWIQSGTRQLLEVVFANRETINKLVRDGALKEGSGSGTIFPCAHNSGNIEQYVVNVQRALTATGEDDIVAVLHPAAKKLFGVR